MRKTTSILLATTLAAAVGVSVFSIGPTSANPFGGSDSVTAGCSEGDDCTANTMTVDATTGSGFACSSVLSSCVDLGPGSNNYVGTNASGEILLGPEVGAPTVKMGAGHLFQNGLRRITNAVDDIYNNSSIQNTASSKAVLIDDADGLRVTPYSATPSCASGSKGTLSVDSDDSRAYFCDGTTTQRLGFNLVASAALDFGTVSGGATSETLTVTLTGAATTDAVHCNPTSDLGDKVFIAQVWVSAANTVSIRLRNGSDTDDDPASTTFACVVSR